MEPASLSQDGSCRRCGSPLSGGALGGNCPACLWTLVDAAGADSRPDPLAPLRFADYELVAEIARGGMGVVWRARQDGLERDVALKMILTGQLATSAQVIRFYTEARAAARLAHPGIVPIHEIGEEEGQHFYTMRLMEGGSLAQLLKAGSLPPEEAARLVSGVARAIHFAHQRGVLHRDVKPSNILLDADQKPHIADFGLARLAEQDSAVSHSGMVLGTPAYMAPEQAAGRAEETTVAADVYGLGAVLYEALTGVPPFQAETPLQTLRLVMDAQPAPPRGRNSALDRDLEVISLKCLEKEPGRRYVSAAELADDLDRWLAGVPIRARPSSFLERLVSWARRKPGLATSLGALIAILCLALAITSLLLLKVEQESAARASALSLEEGQRLAFQSLVVVEENPGQGLLLALEAAARAPSVNARNALLVSLEACRERRRFLGHEGRVGHCSFSRDGRRIATASADGTARVWDTLTGETISICRGHEGRVSSVVFSPDGGRVITAGADGTARIWDAVSGKELVVLRGHEHALKGASFTRDGERAFTVGHTLRAWDTDSGRVLYQIAHGDEITGARLDHDGGRLATVARDHTAGIWDAATGNSLARLSVPESPVFDIQFSGDGRRLAVASGTVARVWDAFSHRELCVARGHRYEVYCLRLSRDGSRLATGSEDFTARVWDVDSGRELRLFHHEHRVVRVDLSPDEDYLLTASWDLTARVWDQNSGRMVAEMRGHAAALYHAVFSPDGREVATASDDFTCRLWTVRPLQPLVLDPSAEGGVVSADVAADGRTLVEALRGTGTARVRDLESEREAVVLRGHEAEVYEARFNPDGKRVITGSEDRTARIWDARTGTLVHTLRGHEGTLHHVSFSPDGRRALTLALDQTARVWNVEDGTEVAIHRAELPFLNGGFGPDSDLVALTDDTGVTRIARVSSGEVRELRLEGTRIASADLGPDGRVVITTGTTRVQVRSMEDWKIETALVHSMRTIYAAYSPDQRWVATTAYDFTVRLWNAATHEEHVGIQRPGMVPSLVHFTWDSRRVVVTWYAQGARDRGPRVEEVVIYPLDVEGEAQKAKFGDLTPDERDHFSAGTPAERREHRRSWKGGQVYGEDQAGPGAGPLPTPADR
jgi:WD40 repeat protein